MASLRSRSLVSDLFGNQREESLSMSTIELWLCENAYTNDSGELEVCLMDYDGSFLDVGFVANRLGIRIA